MKNVLRAVLGALLSCASLASLATATCYTCTQSPPHVCVPTSGQGWEECFSGGRYPCAVNETTECFGGEAASDMLATRVLLLRVSEQTKAEISPAGGVRTLKGRGEDLSRTSLLDRIGLSDPADGLELVESAFSLGDADGDRPVGLWLAQGLRLEARGSFQGGVMQLSTEWGSELHSLRLQSGDVTILPVQTPGFSGVVVLATERIAADRPGLIEHLTAVQTTFQSEIKAWQTEPTLADAAQR